MCPGRPKPVCLSAVSRVSALHAAPAAANNQDSSTAAAAARGETAAITIATSAASSGLSAAREKAAREKKLPQRIRAVKLTFTRISCETVEHKNKRARPKLEEASFVQYSAGGSRISQQRVSNPSERGTGGRAPKARGVARNLIWVGINGSRRQSNHIKTFEVD